MNLFEVLIPKFATSPHILMPVMFVAETIQDLDHHLKEEFNLNPGEAPITIMSQPVFMVEARPK